MKLLMSVLFCVMCLGCSPQPTEKLQEYKRVGFVNLDSEYAGFLGIRKMISIQVEVGEISKSKNGYSKVCVLKVAGIPEETIKIIPKIFPTWVVTKKITWIEEEK